MNFRLWVTMKARRCMMKKGSFDNYMLKTKEREIDSRFGVLLRNLIREKKAKGDAFVMPNITGFNTQRRIRKT